MQLRRTGPWHESRRREPEFGGVNPRIASPLWLRIGRVAKVGNDHRALVVATLFRHSGARGANWTRVDEMLRSQSFKDTVEVNL
jgi:hypothetical protein